MDMRQLTDKAMEHEARLAAHEEEIKMLFNQQKNIEKLADSTHELAKSVERLTENVNEVDQRLHTIESTARKRGVAIWQAVVSAVIGGGITYLITQILL